MATPHRTGPRDAWVVDAVRTPIGRHGGALADARPDDLAARVVGAVVDRAGIDRDVVDDVLLGCTNGAGEDSRNVARMAALLAGLPHTVPGVTINRLCASGMEAVAQATRQIRVEESDVCVAGGVESMTRAPWAMLKPSRPFARGSRRIADTAIGWRFTNPRMAQVASTAEMGETAENVARRWAVERVRQDRFALESHRKTLAARAAGRMDDEIVAVEVTGARGERRTVTADEGPREDTSLQRLATLRPAFAADGTVTAGNSSPINDGAAVLLIASTTACELHSLEPLARVRAAAAVGVDPAFMGIGPIPAVRLALRRADCGLSEVDLHEVNEAFASQVLVCADELGIPADRLNVNGGAIALGHPLGATGARIVGTLAHEMRRRGASLGVASMCVGVGQGMAVVLDRPAP